MSFCKHGCGTGFKSVVEREEHEKECSMTKPNSKDREALVSEVANLAQRWGFLRCGNPTVFAQDVVDLIESHLEDKYKVKAFGS